MKQISGKNLVLIGFMGTGKTEVGRLLAVLLNRRMVDTDRLIVERAGISIRDIFRDCGELHFRCLEKQAIFTVAEQKGLVVATGGGAILDPENVAALRSNGFVVWLDADVPTLESRLAGDNTRPLLAAGTDLAHLYGGRKPLYQAAAHLRIDTAGKSPLAVAAEIIELASRA